jgi:hypothetical protein
MDRSSGLCYDAGIPESAVAPGAFPALARYRRRELVQPRLSRWQCSGGRIGISLIASCRNGRTAWRSTIKAKARRGKTRGVKEESHRRDGKRGDHFGTLSQVVLQAGLLQAESPSSRVDFYAATCGV